MSEELRKRITELEDDLLAANDICVAKTRKLMARITDLKKTNTKYHKALQRIKDLQDGYYEALSPAYCPDIRYEAGEALTKPIPEKEQD